MPTWPTIRYDNVGSGTFTLNGQTVNLGPLSSLDAERTAILLRGLLELLWEATAVPPNAARVAALRAVLGQLRGML